MTGSHYWPRTPCLEVPMRCTIVTVLRQCVKIEPNTWSTMYVQYLHLRYGQQCMCNTYTFDRILANSTGLYLEKPQQHNMFVSCLWCHPLFVYHDKGRDKLGNNILFIALRLQFTTSFKVQTRNKKKILMHYMQMLINDPLSLVPQMKVKTCQVFRLFPWCQTFWYYFRRQNLLLVVDQLTWLMVYKLVILVGIVKKLAIFEKKR